MIIGGKGTPGGLAGPCLGQPNAFPCGRAEPAPPGGGQAEPGWPCGEDPEMTRKAIFSDGRALRVRVVRPDASRGIT